MLRAIKISYFWYEVFLIVYKIVYKNDSGKPFTIKSVKNLKVFANVDGEKKPIIIHDVRSNDRESTVTFDITIVKNPIPLLILGYALLGTVVAGSTGFMLHEVNETSKTLLPLLIAGAGVYLFIIKR